MAKKLHPVIESALRIAIPKIRNNPSLLEGMGFRKEEIEQIRQTGEIELRAIKNAADNHIFDDNPERFGLSPDEGHALRSYFQNQIREEGELDRLRVMYPYLV